MTSVLRCGDDGCPCRNLPNRTDQGDVERLRAEVARLKADAVESRRGLLNWSTDLIDERDAAVQRAEVAEAKIERVGAVLAHAERVRREADRHMGSTGLPMLVRADDIRAALAGEADQ